MTKSFNIIGLGEVLWDCLPDGTKTLGGTTANFAYISNQLGNNGIIASRVGRDQDGFEAVEWLKCKGISTDHIQTDNEYPTGTVIVSFKNGQPNYEVVKPVAWDFLESSENWHDTAKKADAVCFGTLAQRSEISRKTIREFVGLTNGLKVFDVNLRQKFFSAEVLSESLSLANVCKLNHEELPIIAGVFEIKGAKLLQIAENLLLKFGLKLVCVTLGAKGSLVVSSKEVSSFDGIKIEVADTIGAGDAFTAGMTHGLLRGWELDKINEFANRVGAFVASNTGAMPDFSEFKL